MIATLPAALALFALQAPGGQDCRDPQAQSDMNICASIAFERADAELNAEYRRAVVRARAQIGRSPASFRREISGPARRTPCVRRNARGPPSATLIAACRATNRAAVAWNHSSMMVVGLR